MKCVKISQMNNKDRKLDGLLTNISTSYAILLFCIYSAFSYTELVKFPYLNHWLEINGFFIYLYLISIFYFIYLLLFVLRGTNITNNENQKIKVIENEESHCSLALRGGMIIFSLGTISYFILSFIAFVGISKDLEEFTLKRLHPSIGINAILGIIFTILQTYVIVMFPRLNVHCHQFMNRFGTKHIVATNIILWLRTLLKESVQEILELQEEAEEDKLLEKTIASDEGCTHSFYNLMKEFEGDEAGSKTHRKHSIGEEAVHALPILFPFVIEFALIGASVFLLMSYHIGRPMEDEVSDKKREINRIHKPHPNQCMKKIDCSNSLHGSIIGLIVLFISVVNLSAFYGIKESGEGDEKTEVEWNEETVQSTTSSETTNGESKEVDGSEYGHELLSLISNTIINVIGTVACSLGITKIQELNHKNSNGNSVDLDAVLLRFSSCFTILYCIFSIITGSFVSPEKFVNSHGHLLIINGVVEVIQILLQLVFLFNLKEKVISAKQRNENPGRQYAVFSFFFNLSQWLIMIFEIQKFRSSLIQSNFYGLMSWVIIQRVTLPLAVFFRFHSSVISIELWKGVYAAHEESEQSNDTDIACIGTDVVK